MEPEGGGKLNLPLVKFSEIQMNSFDCGRISLQG